MNTLRKYGLAVGATTALGLLAAFSSQAVAEQGTAAQATPPALPGEAPPTQAPPDPAAASTPHQRDVTQEGGQESPLVANPDSPTEHQREAMKGHEAMKGKAGDNERAAGKDSQMAHDTKPKDKLVGLPVESSDGTQIGSVVDIVRSTDGKPTYAVLAIDNDTTAIPYDTATSMIHGDKVVMSQARLANAPRVSQSEWLDETSSKWRMESDRYWGNTRTAEPGDMPKAKQR